MLIFFCLAPLLTLAQVDNHQPAVPSTVYHWPDNNPSPEALIARGSTTHLRLLEIFAIDLETGNTEKSRANEQGEILIIVRDGQLSIKVGRHNKTVGPGSIALVMPEDRYLIENTGPEKARYYRMRYISKAPANHVRGNEAGGSLIVDWKDVEFREHDKGGRRDFFDRPTSMCDDFEMHVTNLNLNTSSHAPHTHMVEEIILMIQGNIRMHIDGKELESKVGDFSFIDSNLPHAPTNIGVRQAIYFAFQWK